MQAFLLSLMALVVLIGILDLSGMLGRVYDLLGGRLWYVFFTRPIILDLHTIDYGALGVRVYVSDETWAARIRKVTGNKTITERNIKALAGLGYRFAITSAEPMEVPTWLPAYLEEYEFSIISEEPQYAWLRVR